MIQIGALVFDLYAGVIDVPKLIGRPFIVPGSPHIGIHLQPATAEPFTLRLTRHDSTANLDSNTRTQRSQVGQTLAIVADGITYASAPYALNFSVLDVRVISAETIPYAAGVRIGGTYQYSPASSLVTDWTMAAVPI